MATENESHVDENIQSDKMERLKVTNTILDNFRKLTKDKEKVRITASVSLVKYLLDNECIENEVKYALERLIRGVGSSSTNARCGFYSTLITFLNYSNITIKEIFEIVDKELHKGKSNSKSENADIAMGHILVCGAILRSELFSKTTDEEQTKVLQYLINAGKERSYLLYPSFELLLDFVNRLNVKEFEGLVLPLIQPELEKPWIDYNLDSLYLLIKLRDKYPNIIDQQILKKITGHTKLLNKNNVKDIANILMNILRISAIKHPIYESFGKVILRTEFTIQFMSHLDEILSKYNKNKHLIIINFLTLILSNTDSPNDVPFLLGNNLIQHTLTIFRQLKGSEKDNELKQLTHKLFEVIHETMKKGEVTEQTKILVLKKLLFSPGTFIFEKITKSKLVQQIAGTLKNEGIKKLANLYKEVIMLENKEFNAETTEIFQNNDRLYAAHLLVKLMGHSEMRAENEWKEEQLKFLMHLGLTKQPKIGVELASSLKETFYHSLDLKLSTLEDLCKVLLGVFNDLDSYISEDNLEIALRSPITPETYSTWIKAKNFINKIESKKTKKLKLVFQVLFLHLGLQLFNNVILAKDSLEELFSCYERIKKKNSQNDNDPSWIEVVVELMLSLLSHNSHLLRKIINCVFPSLCHYLNATNIHQILSVLDPKNEENPLSNKDDISDESEQSEEESCDEDEESDEEISEDDDIGETNNDKLRKALHTALMQNMDEDCEQSDIDLDLIDEEQGEKLNKALGDVFKQFKPNIGKSNKQNKNEETLTHFRVRVLDLIDIYLDSNPSMILTLEIMLPLLQLLEFCIKDNHQKPLQDRVKSCLKKLTNLKKFDDITELDENTLSGLLKSLLEKGTKSNLVLQFVGENIAQCCIFIIKCSENLLNSADIPKKIKKHIKCDIYNIISESLDFYLSKRDCHIPLMLFKQIFSMSWSGNVQLISKLVGIIFEDSIRPFTRNKCIELMKIFYSNNRFLSNISEKGQDELNKISNEFLEKNLIFFNDLGNIRTADVKENFISFLFALIATIKRSPVKCEDFDWKKLGEAIRQYRSFLHISQDTKRSYNNLCSALGVSNIVQMKESPITLGSKCDDHLGSAKTIKGKEEKRKKNKEMMKLKKETKEKRLQSLSEGFKVDFKSVESMNGIEEEHILKENGDNTLNSAKTNKALKKLKKQYKEDSLESLSEDLKGSFENSENMNGSEGTETIKENGEIPNEHKVKKRRLVNGAMSISKKNKT
ncbi:hypothetical protein WA026_015254 [Henosepilachna vigintioctopunctata]|uniref:DNA polymerase V n=1 Tax=Henosepilachna vigintioctopunctata TaxID=420089 RepID=A0AAW1TTJ8_9CUCU